MEQSNIVSYRAHFNAITQFFIELSRIRLSDHVSWWSNFEPFGVSKLVIFEVGDDLWGRFHHQLRGMPVSCLKEGCIRL